jgi:hypothetical protein
VNFLSWPRCHRASVVVATRPLFSFALYGYFLGFDAIDYKGDPEEANNACFIVKDGNGFAVSYVLFRE